MKNAKPGGPSRLTDITVEEVSLVDRAANNHRFLLVKRSEAMLNGDEALEPIELEPDEEEEGDEAAGAGAGATTGEPPRDPWGPMIEALAGITTRLDALLPKPAEDAEEADTDAAKPRPKPAEPTDEPLKPRPKPAEPTDGTLRTTTLEHIGATVAKLLELVKGQGARLTTLEKSTPERASVSEVRSEPAVVSWPLDMNPPTERRLPRPSARMSGGGA